MMNMDHEKNAELARTVHEYAVTLFASERIRFVAYILSLADSIQQTVTIPDSVMQFCLEEGVGPFHRVTPEIEPDDPMQPGYYLHNLLEDMAEDFDDLADEIDQQEETRQTDARRAAALAKLTAAERKLLGLG